MRNLDKKLSEKIEKARECRKIENVNNCDECAGTECPLVKQISLLQDLWLKRFTSVSLFS